MASTKILVLGSGMVARPCVEYLSRYPNNEVTVACRTVEKAHKLVHGLARSRAIRLDITSAPDLTRAIAASDIVISLVPYVYHADIIRVAIDKRVNVVTTSYVSPAIKSLEQEAKTAGVVVVNEVGVDPGIDHLYAIKTIDEVHSKGGKVREFYSFCGGLPAPECANNPLRMKFSWSPRGVFLSQCNSASYYKDGEKIQIPSSNLMASAMPYHVMDGYDFLAYPNRDSTPFREFYNIPEAQTVIRGSLRYNGNPQLTRALQKTGWLDTELQPWLDKTMSWAEITARTTNSSGSSEEALITAIKTVCDYADEDEHDLIISGFRWLGLLSTKQADVQDTLLDTLAKRVEGIMRFKLGERDLVMLQHKFEVEWANGEKETRTSTLELFGDPRGHSGMALSVGTTCGIATQLLLDGHEAFITPGVVAPYSIPMCTAIRERVEREGIHMVERIL